MFNSINSKDEIYIHIICGCGNKFKAEDMYICYKYNFLNSVVIKYFVGFA